MFDQLPYQVIRFTWQAYLGDLKHLLVLSAVCTTLNDALLNEYHKFVRYRLLLSDPRCINYHYFRSLLHHCDFNQLRVESNEMLGKQDIPKDTFDILFALTMVAPTNVLAIQFVDGRTLCFSLQNSRTIGDRYIKCIEFPHLVLMLDCDGGMYPTKYMDTVPFSILTLMLAPMHTLLMQATLNGKCVLCHRKVQVKPYPKMNPGLGPGCFAKYREALHNVKQPIASGTTTAQSLIGII